MAGQGVPMPGQHDVAYYRLHQWHKKAGGRLVIPAQVLWVQSLHVEQRMKPSLLDFRQIRQTRFRGFAGARFSLLLSLTRFD